MLEHAMPSLIIHPREVLSGERAMSQILIAGCIAWTVFSIFVGLGAAAFIYHGMGRLDEDGEERSDFY
jgi:hypothetical protein